MSGRFTGKAAILTAVIATMSGAAGAQRPPGDDFCGALRRIAAAAHERPAFESITAEAERRILARGLGMAICRIAGQDWETRMECWRATGTGELRLETQIAACLPGAVRIADPEGRLPRFRYGSLSIRIAAVDRPRGGPNEGLLVQPLPVH